MRTAFALGFILMLIALGILGARQQRSKSIYHQQPQQEKRR